MFAERSGHDYAMLRLGCLDTEVVGAVVGHIWRSEGASWFDPKAPLAEFSENYRAPISPAKPA
jgi:hypothetical protein